MKVLKVTKTAAPFDRDKAWDGGSYYQPTITCDLSDGGKVVIDDSSCGAFGRRWDATYTDANGTVLATHQFDGCVPFPYPVTGGGNFDSYPDVAAAVQEATGYNLLLDCG